MALAMVIVFELAVSAVRRIFWPQDQDLMQEAERYAGVLDVMKEHAAEAGEAGPGADAAASATGGDGKRTSRDSAADAAERPPQQQPHEWNGHGGPRAARRRSRKISGDVYGAPPFMATPEERDLDPLGDAGSVAGSSGDNARGQQKSASASTYQVGPREPTV